MGVQQSVDKLHVRLSEDEERLVHSGYPIIFVFGLSGAGKSTFINLVAQNQQRVGAGVDSCTDRVAFVEAKYNGKPVVLVDTPGINDTRPSVAEIDALTNIAHSLEFIGRGRNWVTGILYMHAIADSVTNPTITRDLTMLSKLCGEEPMKRVIFCSTMVETLPMEESTHRQDLFYDSLVSGSSVVSRDQMVMHSSRSKDARTSAQKILSDLIEGSTPMPLAIQDQMIHQGKTIPETDAGQVLTGHLRMRQEDLAKRAGHHLLQKFSGCCIC